MMSDDDSGGPKKSSGVPNNRNPYAQLRSKGWITLREFALIAGVSYPTALRWAKMRMIRFNQVGGHKRVYTEEVERFKLHGTLPPQAVVVAVDPTSEA